MDLPELKVICDNECFVSNLIAYTFTNKRINLITIRRKGQDLMQRIYYIKDGKTEFILNDNQIIYCTKGDILYFPPDVTYTSLWEENPNNSTILIKFNLTVRGKETLLSNNLFVIAHDQHEIFLKQFSTLANIYQKGQLGYKIKCQSILLDILYSLIPAMLAPSDTSQPQLLAYKGVLFIENNYMDKFNVNDIAKMCSLSPAVFRKQFHAITNMSPIEYKNYLISKKAAELLQTEEFSVSEVASKVGIEDIYYFNRLFKKYFHVSPGKYKGNSII